MLTLTLLGYLTIGFFISLGYCKGGTQLALRRLVFTFGWIPFFIFYYGSVVFDKIFSK